MAVYKVIQDVEAEDKILGPLSLKQLIFAIVMFAVGFVAFRVALAVGSFLVTIPFLPIIVVLGALAFPFGKDQPTEVWLAAQIRFYTKPRKRIWDQSDIKQLVHVTAPPRPEKHLTDGLNQDQVRSRLRALASTLDSRGWAVKNVAVNDYASYGYTAEQSDRLIDPSALPQAVATIEVKPSDDIFDVQANPTAHHFDELAQQSSRAHIAQVMQKTQQTAAHTQDMPGQEVPEPDYWFMHQNPNPSDNNVMLQENIVQPGQPVVSTFLEETPNNTISQSEKDIIERAKQLNQQQKATVNPHHKVVLTPQQLQELERQKAAEAKTGTPQPSQKPQEHKTTLSKADKIELANANNMKISTLKTLADHKTAANNNPDEVVINLR